MTLEQSTTASISLGAGVETSPIDGDIAARRGRALTGVRLAVESLRRIGVEAKVIGSLARGQFGPHSDVDLLVVSCPRDLKYTIEGIVEDHLADIPFDVVYLDELPARKIAGFANEAVDASSLR